MFNSVKDYRLENPHPLTKKLRDEMTRKIENDIMRDIKDSSPD